MPRIDREQNDLTNQGEDGMRQIATRDTSGSQNRLGGRLVAGLSLTLMAAMLICCNRKVNLVQGISLVPGQTIALNNALQFTISGLGTCQELRIDWGDGSMTDTSTAVGSPVDLTARPTFSHTFIGWRGGKTVTAIGISGCEGRVNTRFTIEPSVHSIGFNQPGPNVCDPVPFAPSTPLPPRTLVHITTIPATGAPFGIDFGCQFQGCRYDADGRPGSVAAAPFPFPGLREYSLVLRVGTQVVQGGKDVRFTTTQNGRLEICINDDNGASNNSGGYQIDISVDQLGPPPP
jgi:hypothetical protein